eukprot:CAMPEP_0202712656 /NCGR_PEP_ID=MMETSP1385-20130828/43563_1 /ASSEMBLY_ACC=CAM_ASM_000861 /TAXON_ID=933848 /ORGANISM="Elphidium margaritaceum" /LENGTH=386 /DNA_ID=CAMNT_0049372751 /DNA_START=44 /DNA_END=1201 /DNA_ORIENTATION=+
MAAPYISNPYASGLSNIEKFVFSLCRSAFCHSAAMPMHRYGTILQCKNTLIEMDDGDVTHFEQLMSSWRNIVVDQNSAIAVKYRTCLLLTSHATAAVFKDRVKRRINVQRTDKRHIRILKRVLFSTVTRVITFSFGHWFTTMQSLYCIDKTPHDAQWRFGFTQSGFGTLCVTTILDQLLWYSSYYWFAPFLSKPIHSKIRTYASNFLIHPLYTIMRRQMLTGESMMDAIRALITRYGYRSLFDGALCEIGRSIIYDVCGKLFDVVLKKYVLWKYDVYGICNTLDLCQEYVHIVSRDSLLVHGWVREFIAQDQKRHPYIPTHIVDLIVNDFYHEKQFDIVDTKMHKFVHRLSKTRLDAHQQSTFLSDGQFQNNVKRLFENKKFQRMW